MTRILIVEDQTLLRDSLKHVVGEQDDMEVAGTIDDAAKAPETCLQLKPDLVLMDVVTKDHSNGITFSAEIRKRFPKIKIVIMTSLPEITFVEEARKAGIDSFMYKDSGHDHLFYVIRSTMKGHGIYPGPNDQLSFAAKFTEKEIGIIRLICQSKTRGEAARELGISEAHLGQQITSILNKSGFDSISKFAIYAVGRGLIVPDGN